MTQTDLATHMGITTTTVGRWESIRVPRGQSLAALARVAREFGRDDLAGVFEEEFQREFTLFSGLGAAARHLGITSSVPLEAAVRELYECGRADQTRRSTAYRAYRQAQRSIATALALLIREVEGGKLVRVDRPGYLKSLEQIRIEIEDMEHKEEKHEEVTRVRRASEPLPKGNPHR